MLGDAAWDMGIVNFPDGAVYEHEGVSSSS
jgi:hypothetical protein